MFDTIAGLPVHPLVVHAAVVLVPLACVGLILVVAVPTLREKYAVLVLIGLVVGTLCVLVAESSGVALAERVGGPGAHATWGERLKVGSLVTYGLASAWFIGTRRVGARWVGALGVIASVAAVVTVALTVMTGHSGASSVWSGRIGTAADVEAGTGGRVADDSPDLPTTRTVAVYDLLVIVDS